MEFEDRLWAQLEAAAERDAGRGRTGRGAAAARALLPGSLLRPLAGAAVAVAIGIAALIAVSPQPPEPQWRGHHVRIGGSELDAGASGFGSLWTYDLKSGQVLRVDPRSHRVTARVPLPAEASDTAIATNAAGVWAVPVQPITHATAAAHPSPVSLARIDPRTNRVTARVVLRAADGSTIRPVGLVALPGAVWVWGEVGAMRIDPARPHVAAALGLRGGERLTAFAAGGTRVYAVTDFGRLETFDARTGARVAAIPIPTPGFGNRLAVVGDTVVVDRADGSFVSVDPITARTRWVARIGSSVHDVVVTGGRLWLLTVDPGSGRDQVLALDPANGKIVSRTTLPSADARALIATPEAPVITTQSGDLVELERR